MTDIALLPFGAPSAPEEQGALALSDDGTIRMEPSPALRDALADDEALALGRSHWIGKRFGPALVIAGALAMAAGWVAGRIWGKSASHLLWPQPVDSVTLEISGDGRLEMDLNGKSWTGGVCDPDALRAFLVACERMRN